MAPLDTWPVKLGSFASAPRIQKLTSQESIKRAAIRVATGRDWGIDGLGVCLLMRRRILYIVMEVFPCMAGEPNKE